MGALQLEQFQKYSKVTWALYLKTVRSTLERCTHLHAGDRSLLVEDYSDEAQEAFDRLLVLNKRERELSLENQAYLKEVCKLLLYLLL